MFRVQKVSVPVNKTSFRSSPMQPSVPHIVPAREEAAPVSSRHKHPGDHLVKNMSRHYNSMTQDGLLIGVTIGGEGM